MSLRKKKIKKRSTQTSLALLRKTLHQNIHVMLSYANKNKNKRKTNTNEVTFETRTPTIVFVFQLGRYMICDKKRKKTEHTNIARSSLENFASKYSRHVVLCKNKNNT